MKSAYSILFLSGLVSSLILACGGDENASSDSSGVGGGRTTDPAAASGGSSTSSRATSASNETGGTSNTKATTNAKATGGQTVAAGGVDTTTGGVASTNVSSSPPSVSGGASSFGGAGVGGNSATVGAGGALGSGGASSTTSRRGRAGGASGTSGSTTPTSIATGGAATVGGASSAGGASTTGGASTVSGLDKFSFFVASQAALTRLSGSANGFGGDLRYGEADGLTGADKICSEIAEASMPGASAKVWRAFLSVTAGPSGTPVNAIDRVGSGPWYDRKGRVVSLTKEGLANNRPLGADTAIARDLPNESGTPNHAPDGVQVDNHDVLTGSNAQGQIGTITRANACNDWTSSVGSTGKPPIGHSWPRGSGDQSWIAAHTAPGCGAGANTGEQNGVGTIVGGSGGYGAIYCFALSP